MTTADNDPTTTTPSSSPSRRVLLTGASAAGMQDGSCRQPLLAIEEPLRSLAAATSLLGHLSVSELEVEGDEIEAVQTLVSGAHTAIARSLAVGARTAAGRAGGACRRPGGT